MGMYQYKCCGEQFQKMRRRYTCPICKSKGSLDVDATLSQSRVSTVGFEPYWETHASGKPVYVSSSRDIDKIERKTGLRLVKGHKRAPSFARQGSATHPPTRAQALAWLDDNSQRSP